MNTPLELPVIAGVSGREPTPAVVDTAAVEAELRGLPLVLLSAFPPPADPAEAAGAGPRTSITALLRRICTTRPGLPVTARNLTGRLDEELLSASRHAGMLVVGQAPAARLVTQVAAHAYCPTLVVPPVAIEPAGRPVLLGLGMTVDDEPTIAYAFEEAALRRVPLLVVHVWCGIPAVAVGRISPFAYDLHQAESAADEMVAGQLTRWAGKYPEVPVERMPLYDTNPAQTLLDASELAGLVVVGAHRRSLGGSQLLGTVARTLIAQATRPVLVVGAASHPW